MDAIWLPSIWAVILSIAKDLMHLRAQLHGTLCGQRFHRLSYYQTTIMLTAT